MYRKLLVPLDGSTFGEHALPLALSIARRAEAAIDSSTRTDFLEMEGRWLALARSYEFAEQLSNFTEPLSQRKH